MAEYIERNAAKNAIYAAMRKHDEYDSCKREIIGGLAEADDAIDSVPSADVHPVRHGRWVKKHDDVCYWHECSECGERLPLNQWRQPWESPYCPNCGARMDKEANE